MVLASCGGSEAATADAVEPTPTAPAPEPDTQVEQDGDAAVAEPAPTPIPTTSDPNPSNQASADEVIEAYRSPIAAAIGFEFDEVEQAEVERLRAVEEQVRACMAAEGFDYRPVETIESPTNAAARTARATLSPSAFVAEYGFGIATFFGEDYRGQGVVRFANELLGPAPDTTRGEAEQRAFEIALRGEATEDTADDELIELTSARPGSCRYEAIRDSGSGLGARADQLFDLLGDEWQALGERIDGDPRIVEHDRSWLRCMSDLGHGATPRAEVRRPFFEATSALGERFFAHEDTVAVFGQALAAGFATMSEADRAAFLEEAGVLEGFARIPDLQAELDELSELELAAAAADWQCTDHALVLAVTAEYEQSFVDMHADQLALIRGG